MRPYSKNKFAYNWHWFWDTGNADIGNQGPHEMDICLWGIEHSGWPDAVSSTGGKYVWKDDQETPNTQHATFEFGGMQMTFDVRNLPTPPEGLAGFRGPNYTGNIFFGEQGYLVVDGAGIRAYKSALAGVSGDAARGAGAGSGDKFEKVVDEKPTSEGTAGHMRNFLDAVRSRDYTRLNTEIAIWARAAAFCHLANIAYRVGRRLRIDPSTGRFLANAEANVLLTRDYRAPYIVPEKV